jgi:hypothetical protein
MAAPDPIGKKEVMQSTGEEHIMGRRKPGKGDNPGKGTFMISFLGALLDA